MKTNHFKDAVFKNNKELIDGIVNHYDGCNYAGRSIPIDECMCDCYVKQIFNLGRDAEKELFQK